MDCHVAALLAMTMLASSPKYLLANQVLQSENSSKPVIASAAWQSRHSDLPAAWIATSLRSSQERCLQVRPNFVFGELVTNTRAAMLSLQTHLDFHLQR